MFTVTAQTPVKLWNGKWCFPMKHSSLKTLASQPGLLVTNFYPAEVALKFLGIQLIQLFISQNVKLEESSKFYVMGGRRSGTMQGMVAGSQWAHIQ